MENHYKKAATVLGKSVAYPTEYMPSILVSVPRQHASTAHSLPCVGYDVWHAYEVSALTDGGVPVVGILKMVYSASSSCMVESKSLKLYLHSLYNEKLGSTPEQVREQLASRVADDISALLHTPVQARVHTHSSAPFPFPYSVPYENTLYAAPNTSIEDISVPCDDGVRTQHAPLHDYEFATHLLRSVCPITSQPDTGSLYVQLSGDRHPCSLSFFTYILSLREQGHFHEQIVQHIFDQLAEACEPSALAVTAFYLRRGGIDINPCRATSLERLPLALIDVGVLSQSLLRQ